MAVKTKNAIGSIDKWALLVGSFFLLITAPPAFGHEAETLDDLLVCYGIEIQVLSSTNDCPVVQIYGTKGTSRKYRLEHTATRSWDRGTTDYFVIPGEKVTNVGIPLAVEFQATGGDDVRFKVITVDYFGKVGWNMTYIASIKDNLNRRDQSLHNEQPRKLHDAMVAYVPINKTCALDTDNSYADNVPHTSEPVKLTAPVSPALIAKISPASGGWIDVPLDSISKISLVQPGALVP